MPIAPKMRNAVQRTLRLGSFSRAAAVSRAAAARPSSLTQQFFLDGERHEAEGWKNAPIAIEAPALDPEAHFESFDSVPRKHRFLRAAAVGVVVCGVAAGLLWTFRSPVMEEKGRAGANRIRAFVTERLPSATERLPSATEQRLPSAAPQVPPAEQRAPSAREPMAVGTPVTSPGNPPASRARQAAPDVDRVADRASTPPAAALGPSQPGGAQRDAVPAPGVRMAAAATPPARPFQPSADVSTRSMENDPAARRPRDSDDGDGKNFKNGKTDRIDGRATQAHPRNRRAGDVAIGSPTQPEALRGYVWSPSAKALLPISSSGSTTAAPNPAEESPAIAAPETQETAPLPQGEPTTVKDVEGAPSVQP